MQFSPLINSDSQAFNLLIINKLPFALLILDEDKKIVEINEKFAQIINSSTKEELLGKYFPDLLANDESEKFENTLLNQASENRLKTTLLTFDGKDLLVELDIQLLDFQGNKGWQIVILSSKEKEKSPALSTYSNQYFQEIIEATPFYIYAIDREYRLTAANKVWLDSYERFLGFRPKIGDFLLNHNKELIKKVFKARYDRALRGEKFSFEEKLENKNEIKYYEVNFSPIYLNEQIEGVLIIARDKTLDKLAEIKIAQSEKKYRDLMDLANDMIFLVDTENQHIIHVNQKAMRVLGYTWEDLVNQPFIKIVPPELQFHYQNLFEEYIKWHKPVLEDIIFMTKKGKRLVVDVNSNVLTIEGKTVMQGVFRDITEKVENQQKIQNLKDFYESILNNIPIEISVFDIENRFLYINPKAIKDDQLREWLVGKTLEDYYTFRKLDREADHFRFEVLRRARNEKESIQFEEEFKRANTPKVFVLRGIKPIFDEKGKFLMTITTGENITYLKNAQEELKISNEKFRNLVETSTDWVWELDENNIYIYSSPKVQEMLGYQPEEILGKTPFDFMNPQEAERMRNISAQLGEAKEPFSLLDNTMLHKDGREVYVETNGVPIFDEKGIFRGFRGIDRDISQKKIAESLLNQTLQELKARNFELDSFVYKVSHDLRAPLTSIMGLISLMKDENDMSILKNYLTLAENRAVKLDNFIKTILSYSKALKEKVKIKKINFRKVVKQCFEDLKYMPNATLISLKIKIEGNTEFYNDEFRINTILKNFISNAIKYINPSLKANQIWVSVQLSENQAIIKIVDNGIGIESELLPKIFDMFFRATDKSEGSGLGLYIVKQNLEQLKGKVEVKSKKGEGTEITLILPNLKPSNAPK
jgi:PAS domain S-box-containing protein